MGPTPGSASESFESVLVAAIPALHRFALFLTRDANRSEDLMQETFARALAHREQFEPGSNCRAWLFKIAHNLHRRTETQATREVEQEDARLEALAAAGVYASVGETDSAGAVFEHPDLAEALNRALERLPEEYRTVVALVDLEDQSYAQAAEILGLPIGTIRSRLFRGRRLLQTDLVAYAQDAGLLRSATEDPAR
jgi:RNA polymerase sigma-70 factor (ECF subfamily)